MSQPWRIVVRRHGGPEVLEREPFDPGAPGAGELLIAHEAIGLNFIDVYHRNGLYRAELPFTPGDESVGRIVAVGAGVAGFAPGERVGCAARHGGYATHRIVPAEHAVRIPDAIRSEDAAATLLKGLTACYLADFCAPLGAGRSALVHSAAGGVGAILVPWLRDKGVVVIAHAGTGAKAASVAAEHRLSVPFAELANAVRAATGGAGVDVVYDGVGQASWDASLASLKRRGLLVSYGNASGAVPPIELLSLTRAGSLFVTRPSLADYAATRAELEEMSARLFERLRRGVVTARIGQRFALAEVAAAHRALEARETVGSTVLLP